MSTSMQEDQHFQELYIRENCGVASMTPADAKLREFFLEEARLLCPATHVHCSEYSKMYALYKRLKRIVRLFTLLYDHNWGAFFPDMQKAFGFYLIEGHASKKERLRIVEELADEISFVTQAAQFNDFITILLEHYRKQLSDIERLLKLYYKSEPIEVFPA